MERTSRIFFSVSSAPDSTFSPSPLDTPFARLGGEVPIRALSERFYDLMSEREPALARLHPCDDDGRVSRGPRDRFTLFFIGWLGGPQDYIAQHGHPRLRMRHGNVPVDTAMRDAWMRCMRAALAEAQMSDDVRAYLDSKLADVADFMRNRAG